MSAREREALFVPRVCIFGGKAFATYVQAKRIVKFITDVGATVNHDPDIGDLLKVIIYYLLIEPWHFMVSIYNFKDFSKLLKSVPQKQVYLIDYYVYV